MPRRQGCLRRPRRQQAAGRVQFSRDKAHVLKDIEVSSVRLVMLVNQLIQMEMVELKRDRLVLIRKVSKVSTKASMTCAALFIRPQVEAAGWPYMTVGRHILYALWTAYAHLHRQAAYTNPKP